MEPSNDKERNAKRSRSDEERWQQRRRDTHRVGRRRDHSDDRSDSGNDEEPVVTFAPQPPSAQQSKGKGGNRTSTSSRHRHLTPSSTSSTTTTAVVSSLQSLAASMTEDTHWSDIAESRPFRLVQNCGWGLVPPWHRDAVLGLRHMMPPWRSCKNPEDNNEHFMYPLWQDPAISEGEELVPPLGDLLADVMAEKASPELLERARVERAAQKHETLLQGPQGGAV